jgi:hypothetical protein
MTRVSPITKGSEARFPVGGRGGHPGVARARSALRPGTPRVTGRLRAVGGAAVLDVSVTTSGVMLIDW